MIWTILDYYRKLTDAHTLPPIKKKDQVLKKQTKTGPYLRGITDQNRTNLISIPDFMRLIPDQYQTRPL